MYNHDEFVENVYQSWLKAMQPSAEELASISEDERRMLSRRLAELYNQHRRWRLPLHALRASVDDKLAGKPTRVPKRRPMSLRLVN